MRRNTWRQKIMTMTLAILMLLCCVTSCSSGSTSVGETQAETGEGSQETSLQITETTAPADTEKDPWDSAVMLADNGKSEYTIIVSAYAADWELDAAQTLVALLATVGADITVAQDTETDKKDWEIVVGLTNRANEVQEDFFTAVGEKGYHIRMVGTKLFIGANSEEGMTAAMEKLTADLLKDDTRIGIYDAYVCQAVDEGSTTPDDTKPITLKGEFGKTIAYAQSIANGVQTMYEDGSRKGLVMKNQQMTMVAPMLTGGHCQVAFLKNPNGVPYLTNTMSAYVELTDGTRHYSADSTKAGRMNIYRYGAYYYENHVLEQDFGASSVQDDSVEAFDLLKKCNRFSGNNLTCEKDRATGILTVNITEGSDPYLNFGYSLSLSTDTYDAVKLTMKATNCASGQIYLAAGPHDGIDGAQLLNFSVSPDGEYHTYVLSLKDVKDYTGKLTTLRLDLDGQTGEAIEITEFQVIKTKPSGVPTVLLDRTLHTYADKLNQVLHFVTTDTIDTLGAYGMETILPKERVNSLVVVDENGQHTTLEGVDWDSVVAVAFDVERAGVFGYILTTAENTGKLKVSLVDNNYVIDQRQTSKDAYAAEENFYVAQRVYTDTTHTFDAFLKAVEEEQNPLTLTVTSTEFSAKSLGYDALRGAYAMDLSGMDFSTAYYKNPNLHYRIDAEIQGDATDRNIYVYSHTLYGNLECGVLLDGDDRVLPMLMQVCKNFQGENEEPIFDKGDTSYGEVYFPLCISANETVRFSVLNLYQNWGKVPLKQISSIQFVSPYYHLSTGATETNCIAPYFVYGKDRWTLPDFRSMSAPLWSGQPQHTSAGRLHFLEYTDSDGNYANSESTVDTLVSVGPVYSDVWMNYISDDGRITVNYRHMEMPQTDENRTYYQIQMKVLEDITFDNFKEDFNIFSMDGRAVFYEQFSYLDENNTPITIDASTRPSEKFYTLGKNAPFFAYHHVSNHGNYVNMALIIKDWDITIGGNAYSGAFLVSDKKEGNLNEARLTLDLDAVTLKAGDTINIDLVLLPWGSQLTPRGNIDSILQVRKDTCLTPLTITTEVGEVIEDAFMPCVKAENNTATFTMTGGENNMAVRVYGFDSYRAPTIETYVDGEWVAYKVACVQNGYDGYGVYYDGDGTYSFAFIVPMSDGEARTFRITGK